MKLFLLLTALFVSSFAAAETQQEVVARIGEIAYTAPTYKPSVVRHIVLFRYRPGTTESAKVEVRRRFLALASSTREGRRYIVSIEAGREISGEGADQGLEDGFIVTFNSEGDRNFYVGQPVVKDARFYDPNHQAFKDFVGPVLDAQGALVFDFAVGR